MTNQELEYLIRRARTEKIKLERLDSGAAADGTGGATPGDVLTWDGDEWAPAPPPDGGGGGGGMKGADVTLNFTPDTVDTVAIAVHGLGSQALQVQLLTTAFDGLWSTFLAPWRILDDNRLEIRTSLGFTGPARAIVSAILP